MLWPLNYLLQWLNSYIRRNKVHCSHFLHFQCDNLKYKCILLIYLYMNCGTLIKGQPKISPFARFLKFGKIDVKILSVWGISVV
jgi:hypothetical protein